MRPQRRQSCSTLVGEIGLPRQAADWLQQRREVSGRGHWREAGAHVATISAVEIQTPPFFL